MKGKQKVIALPTELKEDFENKWEAFCQAAVSAKLDIPADEDFSTDLKRVFALSDFVARSAIREPDILLGQSNRQDLFKSYSGNTYAVKLESTFGGEKDLDMLASALRRFRCREMVRIAWRDLSGRADLSETLNDLSGFADASIRQALKLLYDRQCLEMGTPTRGGASMGLVVIAMGKLGGTELNFSSDVDLVFAYPEDGRATGGPKHISHEDFFSVLARRLLRLLTAASSDGMLFRIDMRLRPYGESGPLVMSFDAMESYYQRQGREWERYAWIKARVIAGDVPAGAELLKRLKPFVYRRYLDFGAFESLRLMKRQISMETRRKGIKDNIKLGPGGIREIEFFAQTFQLIRGGVDPLLQQRRLLKALKMLAEQNYIPVEVYRDLKKAYVFLRQTENRLQEFSDQQTHALPQDSAAKMRLALGMGFGSWDSFHDILEKHLGRVQLHFSRLLEAKDSASANDQFGHRLEGVWQGVMGLEQSRQALLAAGFRQPELALDLLADLKGDAATRALSNDGRERLDRLMPLILQKVGSLEQSHANLRRMLELIKTIERRTCYLALLTENPAALTQLVKLASASSWIGSFLARHPVLLDELLDPRNLYAPPQKSEIEQELRGRLKRLPDRDLERQIEELCIFKQINMLRVATADVTGALPVMKVSDHLTDIAETVLAEVVEMSWQHLTRRHGAPECTLDGRTCEQGFSVIAYGKLGGIELGYDSDLDLVFLHAGNTAKADEKRHALDDGQFFARLGQRVIHLLTAHTPAGFLYETDMRLRPSGSAGLLVSHINAFREYQLEKAWTWEHQALIRARAVCGDGLLSENFYRVRREVLARPRNEEQLREEVGAMRERLRRENLDLRSERFDLKQSPGGIVDIEFIVQFLVLLKSSEFPELLRWTDNVRLLETLATTGILNPSAADQLKDAYLNFRAEVHRLSLQEKAPKIPVGRVSDLSRGVLSIWDDTIGRK